MMMPVSLSVNQRLDKYSEAFDFFIENRALPDEISPDDVLGSYLANMLVLNFQQCTSDSQWRDSFKGELLTFLEKLMRAEEDFRRQCMAELHRHELFSFMQIDGKRGAWVETYNHIRHTFSRTEINIDGYVELFKEYDTEKVLRSLCNDWQKAVNRRFKNYERNLLEANRRKWELDVGERVMADYQARRNLDAFCIRYPQLRAIVDMIGREKPTEEIELDETIRRYLPLIVSRPTAVTEIDRVESGNDLTKMLPVETAIMAGADTEILFYKRFASQQLQQFSSQPRAESRFKTEVKKKKEHRLGKGPIIVSIDTSGSMEGLPQKIANSLLLQLVKLANKQKRKCFVISFSVRARYIDLTKSGYWRRIETFLQETYTGGTDGEEMLSAALNALRTDKFGMADVLIISDFEFNEPANATLRSITDQRNKGTRFYGLKIGNIGNPRYNRILDRMWAIKQ